MTWEAWAIYGCLVIAMIGNNRATRSHYKAITALIDAARLQNHRIRMLEQEISDPPGQTGEQHG